MTSHDRHLVVYVAGFVNTRQHPVKPENRGALSDAEPRQCAAWISVPTRPEASDAWLAKQQHEWLAFAPAEQQQ